jgi:Transposase DDE domain
MDDEPLWNAVYRTVWRVAHQQTLLQPCRAGHPDRYATAQVVLVWLLAALWDWPLSHTTSRLKSWRWRGAMRRLGWRLPCGLPHRTTLLRRARRQDFAQLLEAVNRELIRKLGPDWCELVIDSSPLPVSRVSHDADAAWGHHGLRGYRLHTLLSRDGVILLDAVMPANVHELKVAPQLVRAAATRRPAKRRTRYVSADDGYDSEPLHRCCRRELGAVLVAPLNDRGGKRTMRRTPLRKELHRRWNTPAIRRVRRRRTVVERRYSVAKSARFRLYALPPFVRHLPNVRRWEKLKKVFLQADLLRKRRKTRKE